MNLKNDDLAFLENEDEGLRNRDEFEMSLDRKRQTTLASLLNLGAQSFGKDSSQSYIQQFNSNLAATINGAT